MGFPIEKNPSLDDLGDPPCWETSMYATPSHFWTRVPPGYRTRNRSQSTSWRCSSAAGQFDHFDFHHNQTHQNNWLPLGNHLSLGIIALVYTSLLDSSIHSLSFFGDPASCASHRARQLLNSDDGGFDVDPVQQPDEMCDGKDEAQS